MRFVSRRGSSVRFRCNHEMALSADASVSGALHSRSHIRRLDTLPDSR